jgi:thioesterase domain-containing protein/acyl carrier protein
MECLGRSDNQVKIRGYRIELGEIEFAISKMDTIKQCAVVVCEVGKGDVRLVAFIVPQPQKNVTLQEIRIFLRDKLPEYMIPQHVSQTDQLPLTPNGKIDRKSLSSLFTITENSPVEQYVPPSNDLEKLLVQIWQDILGRSKIGIKENFFDLGGHSLLAVQIVSKILKETGVNLTLATFFTTPTIEELAASSNFAKISEKKVTISLPPNQHAYSYIVPIKPDGSRIPFFCIHCVGGNVLNYNAFVPYLDKEQPLYGLQCKGLDGITEPFNDLHIMARNYVDEIRLMQPNGPYLLGGGSMGGLVAFEMAQQLFEMGQEVGLLVMLDTSCSRFLKCENHDSSKSLFFRIQNGIRCRIRDYRKHALCKSYLNRKIAIPHELRYWFIEQMNLAISDSYIPKPYTGLITMFRAALNKNCTDPYRGWITVANGGIRFFDFECDHNNIVEHVEIAHKLNEVLKAIHGDQTSTLLSPEK